MNLSWYIAKKINFSKPSHHYLSRIIILISRITVTVGVVISLLSISIGIGSKKSIKQRLADFNGHAVIKSLNDTNSSYNSSALRLSSIDFNSLKKYDKISHIQQFALLSGIIRNRIGFEGLIFKGVSSNFDSIRFKKFLVEGNFPFYYKDSLSKRILISSKTAQNLQLKINDPLVMCFFSKNQMISYRKLIISGIFKTNIKNIDENYLIGDINIVRRINKWTTDEIGGCEIFLNDIEDLDNITPQLSLFSGSHNFIEKSTDTYGDIINWINLFDVNIYVLIFIILIVVLTNMIMIFLILIIERSSFIGTMKTLGMKNFELQKIFVYYILLVMIPGLVIGNVLALLFLFIQKFFQFIKLNSDNYFFESVPVYLNPMYFIGVSFILLLISFLILLIPSYLIRNLNITKILKFD